MIVCKNCGEPVEKKYCPNCGQKVAIKRLELKHLLHDIPHAIFHVDSGFFYNLKELFIRPGVAIKNYLEGRRQSFFNPITYMAVLLVFNYFAVKVTNLHYYDNEELLSMTPKEVAFIKEYDETQWWFLEHTYLYMLIAIPLCTFFYYFFFRLFRYKFNFAESATIVMFIIAQGVFMQSSIYLLTGWVRNGVFIRSMEIVNLSLLLLYAAYGMYMVIAPKKNKLLVAFSSVIGGAIVLLLMLASAYWLLDLSKLL